MSSLTPLASSYPSSCANLLTLTTTPPSPGGTLKELFLILAGLLSNKVLKSLASLVSSSSGNGVVFPTRISPGPTLDPTLTIPFSSKNRLASLETSGGSAVSSSSPWSVSCTSILYSFT